MSRASAPLVSASSAAVRPSFSVTVAWRSASPYSEGSTSNAPPVTTSASMRSRYAAASDASCGSAIGRPPAATMASA